MLVHEKLGIHLLRIPLAEGEKHINCYGIEGADGWDLVDAGYGTDVSKEKWLGFFKKHRFLPEDVAAIYLTHSHPDHYGASGWLQKITGAPVYMGAIEATLFTDFWRNWEDACKELQSMFSEHGMPMNLARQLAEGAARKRQLIAPNADLTTLESGQGVKIGEHFYEVILTPGHCNGHVCYYNWEEQVVLAGDHLMPGILSSVAFWPEPGAPRDPLGSLFKTLEANRELQCKMAFRGHGRPLVGIEDKIDEVIALHNERLSRIERMGLCGMTAYEVCWQIFDGQLVNEEGSLYWGMLGTLASMMHLLCQGKLTLYKQNNICLFAEA